jgi:hypothetical protein
MDPVHLCSFAWYRTGTLRKASSDDAQFYDCYDNPSPMTVARPALFIAARSGMSGRRLRASTMTALAIGGTPIEARNPDDVDTRPPQSFLPSGMPDH